MNDLVSFVKETYDNLRQMPELGLKEFKTSSYLAERLKSFGYEVKTNVGVTRVVGVLAGGEPGPVIALRADMNALAQRQPFILFKEYLRQNNTRN